MADLKKLSDEELLRELDKASPVEKLSDEELLQELGPSPQAAPPPVAAEPPQAQSPIAIPGRQLFIQPGEPRATISPAGPPRDIGPGVLSVLEKAATDVAEDIQASSPLEAAQSGVKALVAPLAGIAKAFPAVKELRGGPLASIGATFTGAETIADALADTEFTPKTVTDDLVKLVVREAPLLIGGGNFIRAGKTVAKAIGLTKAAARRNFVIRQAERVTRGGVELGTFGAAAEGLQQFQEGEFIPGDVLVAGAVTGAFGAVAFPLFSPLARQVKKAFRAKRIAKIGAKKKFAASLEAEAVAATKLTSSEVSQAKRLNRILERNEAAIAREIARAEVKAINPRARKKAIQRAAKLTFEREQLQVRTQDVLQGKGFQALQEAKEAFGKQTIRHAGRDIPLFEQTLSSRGIVIPPEEINFLMSVADVDRRAAGLLTSRDPIRLIQQAEGKMRGRLRRLIIEPVENANRTRLQSEAALRQQIAGKAKQLGISSDPVRQRLMFQAGEGRISTEVLTQPEREFVNFTKKTYSDLLDQINQVNRANGFPVVRKRQDYITHIQELNFLQRMGIKPGSDKALEEISKFGRKVKSTFRFEKQRLGDAFKQDLFGALDAYVGPAMRRIHMTRAAVEVQSRNKFLPPNLRRAMDKWVEGPVLGGLDPTDAAIIQAGLDRPLRFLETLSGFFTRGVIGMSLRVSAQQPSQIIATGALTGFGPMFKGLARGTVNPPQKLFRASNFLTGRTIQDELVPIGRQTFRKFDKFLGAALEYTDRYVARASWYAGFERAKRMGLSDQAAVKFGDDIGRMLHANYQQFMKAEILRGRKGRAVLPFQTFAFNLWNLLIRDPRVIAEMQSTGRVRETMKLVGSMIATNQIYDAIGLPTPFSVRLPEEATPGAALAAARETVLGFIPVVGSAFFGGKARVPSPTVQLLSEEAEGLIAPDRAGNSFFANLMRSLLAEDEDVSAAARKRALKKATRLLPGGAQIFNTLEGIEAARDGYYTVGQEEVDIRGIDKAIGVLLGPTATKPVREERQRQEIERINKAFGRE